MVPIDMPKLADSKLADSSSLLADGQLKSQSIEVNPSYGSGRLYEVLLLQSGISIVIQNFSLYGSGEIRLFTREKVNPPLICFPICLSGFGHISYTKPKVSLGDGFSYPEFPGYEPSLFMEVKSNTPIQSFAVCIDPAVFEELTGKSCSELAESLDILDWRAGKRSRLERLQSLDIAQKICSYQALASFNNYPDDTFFLEAKGLELVALQLRQLDHLTGKIPRKPVADYNAEKIYYACEILRIEMENPPNKLELARRVGLNDKQLIQGFKKMFGLCPFEYLRAVRLEKARDLIASNECNITEAAFSVGYSSLSHFTKIFRNTFGINPKAFAKESKNKSIY